MQANIVKSPAARPTSLPAASARQGKMSRGRCQHITTSAASRSTVHGSTESIAQMDRRQFALSTAVLLPLTSVMSAHADEEPPVVAVESVTEVSEPVAGVLESVTDAAEPVIAELEPVTAAPEPEPVEVAVAAPTVAQYTDPIDKFSITIPSNWAFGQGAIDGNKSYSGASGERRTIAWFVPDSVVDGGVGTNVSVVVTNTSYEFTSLGSFGNVDTFASSLVNSMDRSYLLKAGTWGRGKDPIQIAKLVDAKVMNKMYFVEYKVQKPPAPGRHLLSLLALAYNGTYNRLYTVTAQCPENELAQYRDTLQQILSSFVPPPSLPK